MSPGVTAAEVETKSALAVGTAGQRAGRRRVPGPNIDTAAGVAARAGGLAM